MMIKTTILISCLGHNIPLFPAGDPLNYHSVKRDHRTRLLSSCINTGFHILSYLYHGFTSNADKYFHG